MLQKFIHSSNIVFHAAGWSFLIYGIQAWLAVFSSLLFMGLSNNSTPILFTRRDLLWYFRYKGFSRKAKFQICSQPFVLIFSLLSLSSVSRHSSSIVKYLNDFIEYIGKTHFNCVAFRLTGKIWNGRLPRVLCASDPYIESDFGETEVRKYHAAYWYALQFIFFAINWNF